MDIEKVCFFCDSSYERIETLMIGDIADALLGRTFYNGIRWDPDTLAARCKPEIILFPFFFADYESFSNS